jgi:hypothetical protein
VTTPGPDLEPDPEHIAALTLTCPLVAGLHGGRYGEAATYLPRRRVIGVRVAPTEIGVHVTARYPATISEVDAQVRVALTPYLAGLPLVVTIEDYAPPPSPPTARSALAWRRSHDVKESL